MKDQRRMQHEKETRKIRKNEQECEKIISRNIFKSTKHLVK